jgi:hypothetical protein
MMALEQQQQPAAGGVGERRQPVENGGETVMHP